MKNKLLRILIGLSFGFAFVVSNAYAGEFETAQAVVVKIDSKIYKDATTDSEVIGTIDANNILVVSAVEDGFVRFMFWGSIGYGWLQDSDVMSMKEGVIYYSELLERFPTATNFRQRGGLHIRLENYSEAVSDLEQSLRINPMNTKTIQLLAEAMQGNQQFVDAIEYYETLLEKYPSSFSTWLQKAECESAIGKVDAAMETLDMASEFAPSQTLIVDNKIKVLMQNERFEQAIEILDALLIQSPSRFSTLIQRAQAHEKLGKMSNALDDYSDALTLNPNIGDAHHLFALFLLKCDDDNFRDVSRAKFHFRNAFDLGTNRRWESAEMVSEAEWEMSGGDKFAGQEWMAKAIEIAPDEHKKRLQEKMAERYPDYKNSPREEIRPDKSVSTNSINTMLIYVLVLLSITIGFMIVRRRRRMLSPAQKKRIDLR